MSGFYHNLKGANQMSSIQVNVQYPERLSRGALLLKTFLGWFILIPHMVCLYFLGIAAGFVAFISWFAVLFTGKYPQSFFNFIVNVQDWGFRVGAYYYMLRDEYPTFGFEPGYPASISITYPEKLSRLHLLAKTMFGLIYIGIPHIICLFGRVIALGIICFIAWWVILFTGKIPSSMFSFITGTFRWIYRVLAYWFYFITDEYPPFSGKDKGDGATGAGVSV